MVKFFPPASQWIVPDVCTPHFGDHWSKQRLERVSNSSMSPAAPPRAPCQGLQDILVLLNDPCFQSSSHTLVSIPKDPTDPIFKFTMELLL